MADGEACGDEALELGGVGGFGAWGFEPGPAEGVGEVSGEKAFINSPALDEGEDGGDAAACGGVEGGLYVGVHHPCGLGAGLEDGDHRVRSWRVQAPTSCFRLLKRVLHLLKRPFLGSEATFGGGRRSLGWSGGLRLRFQEFGRDGCDCSPSIGSPHGASCSSVGLFTQYEYS